MHLNEKQSQICLQTKVWIHTVFKYSIFFWRGEGKVGGEKGLWGHT